MFFVDVSAQGVTFLLSILLGFLLCFFYDIVRVLHSIFLKGFLEVLVTDLLFWFSAAILTFCFLIIRCGGVVRGFVLFGILIGFILLRITLSKFLIKFITSVFKLIYKIVHFIKAFLRRIFVPVNKYFKKIVTDLKYVLQHRIILLYNHVKRQDKNSKKVKET